MHHLQRKSAAAKYRHLHEGGATPEQLKEALAADEKGYSDADIQEIIGEITKPAGEGKPAKDPAATPKKERPVAGAMQATLQEVEKPASPNDTLDLEGFNYNELKGQEFIDYVSLVGDRSYRALADDGTEIPIVGQLREHDEYDFVLYKAVPIMKARFPGIEKTPFDFVGISIKEAKAIHKTRIPVGVALEMNAQILNAHSRAGHGKYYFLAKK